MVNPRTVLTVALTIGVPSFSAVGQNALGGGHALDANPSATQGRTNQRAPSQFNLGPATARSFRRTFSPTTDAEFRRHNIDNVGQRLVTESLYNNPWYWQNAGSLYTEMLTGGSGAASSFAAAQQGQYNPFFYDQWESPGGRMRLAAGQQLSGLASSLDATPPQARPGTAGNLLQVPSSGSTFLHDDRMGTMLRSGRDAWREEGKSRIAGSGLRGIKEPVRFLMSPLRGVTMASQNASPVDIGLDDWDSARMYADRSGSQRMASPGRAWNTRFTGLNMAAERMNDNGLLGSDPGLMRPVMQSVADRYDTLRPQLGSTHEALDSLDKQYRRMRTAVVRGGAAPLTELIARLDDEIEQGQLQSQSSGETDADVDVATTGTSGVEPGTVEPLSPTEFGLIIKHGQTLATLSSGDRTRFDDLVAAGEKALREGSYLRADRRFSRALRFVPGQPLATAGLVNAQVGGGLYLSAALTLKSLLGFQPEMIDVRFDTALLPQEAALNRAISITTGRITKEQDLDRNGLLLAWLGHQLDRPILIQIGLDAMHQSGRDKHFTDLLEQVWSEDAASAPVATPDRTPLKPVPLTADP